MGALREIVSILWAELLIAAAVILVLVLLSS